MLGKRKNQSFLSLDSDRNVQISRRSSAHDLLGGAVGHVPKPGNCQLHLPRLPARDRLLQHFHALYGRHVH